MAVVDGAADVVAGRGRADRLDGVNGAVVVGAGGERAGREAVGDAVGTVDVLAPGGVRVAAVAGRDVASLDVAAHASFLGAEEPDGRVGGHHEADQS